FHRWPSAGRTLFCAHPIALLSHRNADRTDEERCAQGPSGWRARSPCFWCGPAPWRFPRRARHPRTCGEATDPRLRSRRCSVSCRPRCEWSGGEIDVDLRNLTPKLLRTRAVIPHTLYCALAPKITEARIEFASAVHAKQADVVHCETMPAVWCFVSASHGSIPACSRPMPVWLTHQNVLL